MLKEIIKEYRWVGVATLLFYIVLLLVPKHGTDFVYSRQMVSNAESSNPYEDYYMMSGDEITSLQQWIVTAKNHYLYHDNGRFANILAMGQAMIPHWIYDLFLTACYAVLLTMMLNISGHSRKSAGAVAAMALAMWWFLNWDAPMLSVDYLLNYLFSAAAVVWFVWRVTRGDCRLTWGMIILALVAGISHEGFSVSFGCGLFAWLIFCRRNLSRPQKVLCLIYYFGVLLITVSPSLIHRMYYAGIAEVSYIAKLKSLIRDNIILPITLIALSITVIRHRKSFVRPITLIISVSAITALVIFIFSNSMTRALRPEQTALTALLFNCIPTQWFSNRYSAIIFWSILLVWLSSLFYWLEKMREDFKVLEAADTDIIYYDFSTLSDTPVWLGSIPSGPGTCNESFYSTIGGFRNARKAYLEEFAFFPTAMLGNDTSLVIPGTAGLRGRFPFFISTERLPQKFELDITFGAADALRSTNLVSAITGAVTGKLFSPIKTRVWFTRKTSIAIDKDTFGVYSNDLWFLGANDYGRELLRADTIPQNKAQ